MTDRELLHRLLRRRSDDAFNEIIRRHLGLVHSAALRQLGDSELARDVAQNVFIRLARQIGQLHPDVVLTGWLYRTTRNLCLEYLRQDQRRRDRERAAADQFMNPVDDLWEHIAPELEPAMDELNESDRHAVLLRYFESKSLREVGDELGVAEDAAQKRVSRALDRLRGILEKRGLGVPATALSAAVAGGAVQAAPAALITTVATATLGVGWNGAAATSTLTAMFNLKTTAAVLVTAAVTGTTTYLVKESEAGRVRAELASLSELHGRQIAEEEKIRAALDLRERQIERLEKDAAELPRLRGEVDRLNRTVAGLREVEEELLKARQQLSSLQARAAAEAAPEPDSALPAQAIEPGMFEEEFLVRYGFWTRELERETAVQRLNNLRRVGLGLILYADEQQGWYPGSLEEITDLLPEDTTTQGVVLLYSGALADLRSPSTTLVARQEHLSKSADGSGVWRAYTFADGHSEIHRAATAEELAAWEQERIIPPDSQRRRPE